MDVAIGKSITVDEDNDEHVTHPWQYNNLWLCNIHSRTD